MIVSCGGIYYINSLGDGTNNEGKTFSFLISVKWIYGTQSKRKMLNGIFTIRKVKI
jgi:hypothetical protein